MKSYRIKKRKTKYIFVNSLIIVVLIIIIISQTIWLQNMYTLLQRELDTYAKQAAQESVMQEIIERTEEIGGQVVYSTNMSMSNPNDTSRFFTKKVISEDSTYFFTIDKQDPNSRSKIIQFLLKDELPINIDKLNEIFTGKISQFYEIENTYFNYIDLKKDLLLKTNKPTYIETTPYLKTDTISLDILNSIGIIGYVKVRQNTILNNMMQQLILSVILILIAVICLIYISRSFIFQWKTEKMRQESVNAMTHEFKRPISGAVALISVIPHYLKKNEINKVLTYIENTETELNKLTHYTQRIQQISNNEKQEVNLEKTNIEIVPFFESLQQRYGSSDISERKITVNLNINTSKKELCVDVLHFSNVMDNLIENAIKYTINPIVIIDINILDSPEGLKITVRDNGIGISSTDNKRIFEKFYRVKRDETKNKVGFGLGLTYVKSIIEAHGGSISVQSKLNEGSEFIITLKE